jgi:hypothetical protein
MHRPHIPKLAFQSTSGAITRPPAAAVQQPSFGIQGVAATVTSPTRATAAAAAAASSSQHSQLFHSRAAPPAIRSAHTSSSSQQQQQQQHRIPAHHISEEFRALEDEQREDEEQGDQGEEEELNADEDDYEADFQSEPITAALNGAGSRANKQNAAGSSSVYARAEELLDQSDDDLDSRPTTAAATTTVTRRPLRDEAFVAEDGITSERIIPITGRSAAAASRRTSRGSAARSDGSATATSAAHAASGTTATAAVPARSRLDRGSLRNWVSTASQMRQRAELLEKEHSAYLHSRQGWFTPGSEELRAIDELERGAVEAAERVRRERESLQAEMKRIATLVQRFKTHVGSPVDQEAYVTQLRQLMESIEESLAGFKARAKEKYIALNKAEIELEKECDAMLVGFERWSEAPEDPVIAKPQASKSSPEKADAVNGEMKDPFATEADSTNDAESLTTAASIRSALERLDDQIASSGGSTGFWDSRDHAHYLKLLTQRGKAGGGGATASVKDDPEFLARMVAEISGQTPSTALSHILWHATWQSRVAEKKRLIARWKEVKERERDVEGLQEELERQQEWEANERKEMSVHRCGACSFSVLRCDGLHPC